MKKIRIILAGGGTGGHIFPLIAVSQALRELSAQRGIVLDARYFGGAHDYSGALAENDIRFVSVISSKLRRYVSTANFWDIPKFFWGLSQALWKVYWFMPDAVFSKGGPGALSVVLACKFYMVPIIVHESDSVPGQTNVISGKLAKKIFLAFASATDYFSDSKIAVVGNPVRQELAVAAAGIEEARFAAKKKLDLADNIPVLMVMGGSQGARRLNEFMLENLNSLIGEFQIIHQTGEGEYETFRQEYSVLTQSWSEEVKKRYRFKAFWENELKDIYLAADLAVARAGAGTIFELAVFGKPAILMPLPEAAGDHQTKNAYEYADTGAALVIEQKNFLGNLVMDRLIRLIRDPGLLQQMGMAARKFYRPDAAQLIADGILSVVKL